jgi:drug/metabolite transporter (DMT)-like permease
MQFEGTEMPQISQLFFKTAVVCLIVGLAMGLQMGMSGNHTVIAAHAHLNLLGWVSCSIFGGYYALNPAKAVRRIAMIHYGIYVLGLIVMLPALYFMELGNPQWEPAVGIGAIIVFVGVLVFAVIIFSKGITAISEAGRA